MLLFICFVLYVYPSPVPFGCKTATSSFGLERWKDQSAPLERLLVALQTLCMCENTSFFIICAKILLQGCSVVSVAVSVVLHGSNSRWWTRIYKQINNKQKVNNEKIHGSSLPMSGWAQSVRHTSIAHATLGRHVIYRCKFLGQEHQCTPVEKKGHTVLAWQPILYHTQWQCTH